jgi:phospholipid/cholesterol/gamma-HCH transport system substrate-binding protein
MATRAPTVTRILIAVGFALSCFGLALFLWIAFGGPIPLKPESYRITVPFEEATTLAQESDVRISGVSVGKVKAIELGENGLAEAQLELEESYAPIPMDTEATLRQKTLLGETYVELTPGTDDSGTIPEGGELPEAQVSDAVQLDEIFRAFDDRTRASFQAWMQGQAASLRGRGDDLSMAIATLDPFAEDANRALRVLDSQEAAVKRFVRDGGEVFEALSERKGQLRGLIQNSDQVFATTAARNEELAEAFRIFPTFLRESRTTLTRLEEFAQDTDPLVQQLRPAAVELTPTLIDLGRLAPDLEAFLRGFGNTIDAGRRGLPATRRLLKKDVRPLLARVDPYFADFNSIFEGAGLYKREIAAFVANAAAATNAETEIAGSLFPHLRTEAALGPESLAAYPRRLLYNRTNPYVAPEGFLNLTSGLESFETRQCATGVDATLDPADAGAFPGDLFDRIVEFAYADIPAAGDGLIHADDLPNPACVQQADFNSIGVSPEVTQYMHVREEP